LSYLSGMLGCVTAVRLRQWRGVKPVAGPCGVAITTRLRTTPDDEHVLDLVAEHLGRLRRADLARVCHPAPLDPSLDGRAKLLVRRDRLNTRKKALTAESSARWANAIIAANDAQYRLARGVQHRHIISLRAAIDTIEKRLAQPTADTLAPEQRKACRKAELPKGYPAQAERFQKQRRLQALRAKLGRACADWDNKRVHVVEGGKRLATTRRHLDAAGLTLPSGAKGGTAPGTASKPSVRVMNRSATLPSPSPRTVKSVCGSRNRWSTWPTPNTAVTSCPVVPCFLTGPTSGGPGSPATGPSRTP
jgi:hypothetical protein